GVRLEGALEVERLADLAQGRHHLLPQEADAGAGVGVADGAVIAPDRHDAGSRLFEDALQLRNDGFGRAGDDLHVGELLLEGWAAARARRPADGELDEAAALLRREIARWARPDGMGKTGELALHPHELARVLDRLLFGLGDVDALEIAAVLRPRNVTDL